MPGANKDNLPTFIKGQALKAAPLNQIVAAIKQQNLQPGQFQSGSLNLQRPLPRAGADFQTVAILETIAAATWDAGDGKLTPTSFTAPLMFSHADADGTETYDPDVTISAVNKYAESVTIAAGKFRVGYVLDGALINVDCAEHDQI